MQRAFGWFAHTALQRELTAPEYVTLGMDLVVATLRVLRMGELEAFCVPENLLANGNHLPRAVYAPRAYMHPTRLARVAFSRSALLRSPRHSQRGRVKDHKTNTYKYVPVGMVVPFDVCIFRRPRPWAPAGWVSTRMPAPPAPKPHPP